MESKYPQDQELGCELSDSYTTIAELLQRSGDLSGASASFRKAEALLERLAKARSPSFEVRRRLAVTDLLLGNLLGNNEVSNLGDTKGGMELSQKSRVLLEALIKERPFSR